MIPDEYFGGFAIPISQKVVSGHTSRFIYAYEI